MSSRTLPDYYDCSTVTTVLWFWSNSSCKKVQLMIELVIIVIVFGARLAKNWRGPALAPFSTFQAALPSSLSLFVSLSGYRDTQYLSIYRLCRCGCVGVGATKPSILHLIAPLLVTCTTCATNALFSVHNSVRIVSISVWWPVAIIFSVKRRRTDLCTTRKQNNTLPPC